MWTHPPKPFLLFEAHLGAHTIHKPPLYPNPAPKVCNLVKKLEICQPGNFAWHPQAKVGDGRRFLWKAPFLENNPPGARTERELRRLNWLQEASPIVSLEDLPKFNLLPSDTALFFHSRPFLGLPSPRVQTGTAGKRPRVPSPTPSSPS